MGVTVGGVFGSFTYIFRHLSGDRAAVTVPLSLGQFNLKG